MSHEVPEGGAVRRRRQWPHRLIAAVAVLIGAAVSIWPVGETLLNDRADAGVVAGYEAAVRDTSKSVLSQQWTQALAYNADLPADSLGDPWDASPTEANTAHDHYLNTLDAAAALGRIRIPAIDVDLPVFHDAGVASMKDGVGHMYGSSLPVGGLGTHAVLAAHTGLSGRTRFDRLIELSRGDTFFISVANQTLVYRVDRIDVVEPWDLKDVQRVPGQDYVTLVTCYTPPRSHTQRLLVRGARFAERPGSTASSSTEDLQVRSDVVIQTWMWPRLICAAAALGIAGAMGVGGVAADRRNKAGQDLHNTPRSRTPAVHVPGPGRDGS